MEVPTTTSLTLLGRARNGDAEAWERIVDIYGPFLLGRLRSWGLNEADAADVLQEVFASVSQSLEKFQRDRPGDSFLKWLQTIATNKLKDFWRKQAKQPGVAAGGSTIQHRLAETAEPFEEEDWSTDAVAQQDVLRRALELIKAEFREKTWKAFWLYVVDGKTPDEIFIELGMKPGTQRNARLKVRKRLVEELGEMMGLLPDDTNPSTP